MSRKVIVKIFLDIVMLILYALLMFAQGLGGFFHETVGLGIGIFFIIHAALNIPMIKGLFKAVQCANPKPEKMILLVSDIALTLCMPIVIVTGALMAKELFAVNSGISWQLLFDVHNILSYVCLGIMVLHLLMHAKYLVGVFKKLPSSGTEMRSAVCRFSAGAAAGVVLYTSLAVFKNYTDKDITNNQYLPDKNTVSAPPVISQPNSSVNESVPDNEQSTESTVIESVPDNEKITESTAESVSESTETTPPPSVEEYLSKLICTGCGKRCSLLSPRCGKGQMQAERAKEQYNQTYAG